MNGIKNELKVDMVEDFTVERQSNQTPPAGIKTVKEDELKVFLMNSGGVW